MYLLKVNGTKQYCIDIIEANIEKTKYFVFNWEKEFTEDGKVISIMNLKNIEKLQ